MPLLMGVGLGVWVAVETRTRKRLQKQGIEAEGEIIGRRTAVAGRGERVHYVTYRYQHAGRTYERKQQVNRENYGRWGIGAHLPIRYLADNPTTARITGEASVLKGTMIVIVGMALLSIIFLAIFGVASSAPQRCSANQRNGSYTTTISGTPYTVTQNAQGTPTIHQQCLNAPGESTPSP